MNKYKIPGTRYRVGSKKEFTIYDGDDTRYYKYKQGFSIFKFLKSLFQ